MALSDKIRKKCHVPNEITYKEILFIKIERCVQTHNVFYLLDTIRYYKIRWSFRISTKQHNYADYKNLFNGIDI